MIGRDDPSDADEPAICRACGQPIEPFSEIYAIGPEHWACHQKSVGESQAAIQRMDSLLSEFSTRKKPYVPVGQGGPTRKLEALVLESAREEFPGAEITDVRLRPVDPYWRRVALDVRRIEGSITIDGRQQLVHSWHNVTELVRYRKLKWTYDNPGWELSPDQQTRRVRRTRSA